MFEERQLFDVIKLVITRQKMIQKQVRLTLDSRNIEIRVGEELWACGEKDFGKNYHVRDYDSLVYVLKQAVKGADLLEMGDLVKTSEITRNLRNNGKVDCVIL